MSRAARRFRALIACAVLVGAVAVIAALLSSWWDVLFLGVIVATLIGAAIAVQPHEYAGGRRTFVRTSKPKR
jgi:ABC-type Mn2+/Zn2+ transport system permease subunit